MTNPNNQPIPNEVKVPATQSIQTRQHLKDYLRQIRFIEVYGEHEGRRFEGRMVIQHNDSHFLLTQTLTEMGEMGHFITSSELPNTVTCIAWGSVRKIEYREDGFRFGNLDFRFVEQRRGEWSGGEFSEWMSDAEQQEWSDEHLGRDMMEYLAAGSEGAQNLIRALLQVGQARNQTEAEREHQRRTREEVESKRAFEIELLSMEIAEHQAKLKELKRAQS